jgi:hypothetical protein
MSKFHEPCQCFAKGQLRFFDKETGQEITKKNLVVKNSAHISVLGLGGDILNTTVRVASWGDLYPEEPSQTGYNWTKFESLEGYHVISGNHTHKEFNVTGHSYPAHKSIKFTFEFDRNNASDFIGKNLLEWGLFFNDVMFSRVALEDDFVFQSYMTIVGEWTIVFSTCSGGYSNFILNQYELGALWGMDYVDVDTDLVEDYVGENEAIGIMDPPLLVSNLLGVQGIDSTDFKHQNAIPTFYGTDGKHNILYVEEDDQDGALDLQDGKFTIWQWFKIIDGNYLDNNDNQWVLLSKWAEDGLTSDKSYKLYIQREDPNSTLSDLFTLNFEINDNGTIKKLESDLLEFDINSTLSLAETWCLVVVVLDLSTQELIMYLNDVEIGSLTLTGRGITPSNDSTLFIGSSQKNKADTTSYMEDYVPYGFIDETAISHDTLSRSAISLLWANGTGDFYVP